MNWFLYDTDFRNERVKGRRSKVGYDVFCGGYKSKENLKRRRILRQYTVNYNNGTNAADIIR